MSLVPIKRKHPSVYVLSWGPITGLLILVMQSPTGMGYPESGVLAALLAVCAQFLLLSARYTCRVTPLQSSNWWRIFVTHAVAAQLLSFFWVSLGHAYARGLSQVPYFHGLSERFAPRESALMWTGIVLYLLSVAYHYVEIAQEASQEAEAKALETSVLAREAELKALRAQINPHFLFNSLNSISALTGIDPSRARDMCILLADFLRMTLGMGERNAIPFSEELKLLEKFMAIEKVRFGDRLRMEEQIDEQTKSCLIPPLILQPLVENAVGHGIANLTDGGTIRITANLHNQRLFLAVENTFDPEATSMRRGGLGLRNVQARIEARYGKEGSVAAKAEEDLFRVNLSFPAEMAKAEA